MAREEFVVRQSLATVIVALGVFPASDSAGQAPASSHGTTAAVERKLTVEMARGTLWNPWTLSDDPVELRSFKVGDLPSGRFVGPTIRVRPGAVLRLGLENRLPACAETSAHGGCINDTNIHTHGLWVSPAGNSDNVLIAVRPGGRFDYEFLIPTDHPAGTFWYHPHRHGSSLYQLGSGMAGALIVEGDRLPTADRPGDIDVLLRDECGRAFPDRELLLQQINYACYDQRGALRRMRADGDDTRPWLCAAGETGRVEARTPFGNRSFWRQSGRYTNPFQIVSIHNAEGVDVIDPGSPGHDPDYAGLTAQWRDSMTLKSGYEAVLRTRYERFIGDFVLHCHIVQHGDQGMMQNLRIVPPVR
jgi:FtsP/CotA-like multicopper oxidase with cupredoxin domain